MNRRIALVAVVLFVRTSTAQLAPAEREIAAYVDAQMEEGIDLLARSVDINSGSMNFEGVREVGRVFENELAALGFETRWSDGAEWERAGHLLAEREGGAPHVLLIGHLDTVFEPDSPFQKYTRVDESTAAGPGIIDMKGGNVIIIQALKALQSAGVLDDLHVTVVLHGDEEKSGRPISTARRDIIEAAGAADIALAFEPGDGNPRTALIARRGWTGWTLEVNARPAHSSQIFQPGVGAGAAYETARILAHFYEDLSAEKYLTLNAGLALAGTEVEHDPDGDRGRASGKSNVIPQHAIVSGDLRALSPEQLDRAKARMREIVGRNLPRTTAAITFDDSYPPMAPTEGNDALLRLYDEVSRDLGLGAVAAADPLFAGAADISFVAGEVNMSIDGLGLLGTGSHTVRETADLKTLPTQTKRAALLMYRLITPTAPWEADIADFEKTDRDTPPPKTAVLFVGSSSIRMWSTLASDFSDTPVVNRGFGGSQLSDVNQFVDRIVIPYRPRTIVLYAGDNDIAAGESPEQVFADFRSFVDLVRSELPDTRIAFIAIKPSIERWQLVGEMRRANEMIGRFAEGDSLIDYIDVFTPMLGPDGKPRPELFLEDGLHLNSQGYALWRRIVAPYVR